MPPTMAAERPTVVVEECKKMMMRKKMTAADLLKKAKALDAGTEHPH
jgi:intracellular sulfur oxidation DsrE/DsrF family protein